MTGYNSIDSWVRFTPQQRMKRHGLFLAATFVVVWALRSINVIWEWVWDAPIQLFDLFGRMVPPDPTNLPSIPAAIWQTINIATIATFIAVFLSLPVAYIAAQNTTPNRITLWIGRFIFGFITVREYNHLGAAVRCNFWARDHRWYHCDHVSLHRVSGKTIGRSD